MALERRILELVFVRQLVHHGNPPEGLRMIAAGDVVAESSFEGELNAVFRTSGFSLLTDGTWTEYPWEQLETPLSPVVSMEEDLRIALKDGRVLTFQVDHFGGYYSVFSVIAQWFRTGGQGGWWRRIVEEGLMQVLEWRPRRTHTPRTGISREKRSRDVAS